MALVKNIHGSSDNNAPVGYSSWKDYWEKNKHRKFSTCSCLSCSKLAEVGGHVKRVYGSNEWFIVPLCYDCNNYSNEEAFEVRDSDMLSVR